MKHCKFCGTDKELSEFAANWRLSQGVNNKCRACVSAYNQSRKGDPEYMRRSRERSAKWTKVHPEARRAARRRWDEANKGKRYAATIAAAKAKRAADPEAARAKGRADANKWRLANPERAAEIARATRLKAWAERPEEQRMKARVMSHKRRDRTRGEKLDPRVALLVLKAGGGRCVYCRRPAKLTLDHIDAISRGGRNLWSNLLPSCRSCNCSKGASPVEEWAFKRFGVEGLANALIGMKTVRKVIRRLHPQALQAVA